MPAGRPSLYSPELADRICHELATSERGIHHVCSAEDMPDPSTVFVWLTKHPEFQDKYARAKELQGEYLANQILAIADDGEADVVIREREDGSTYTQVDQEHINRSRLRVDSRKWLASKLFPKKYGDRIAVDADVTSGGKSWSDILREKQAARAARAAEADKA